MAELCTCRHCPIHGGHTPDPPIVEVPSTELPPNLPGLGAVQRAEKAQKANA